MTKKDLARALGLSTASVDALLHVHNCRGGSTYMPNFSVGEGLRKRGLLCRHSSTVVKEEFANFDGVHTQWSGPARKRHEWWTTGVGDAFAEIIKAHLK